MTEQQQLRAWRRELTERHRRERLWDAIKVAVLIAFLLLAFGIAGAMDCEDRAADMASMLPDAGWEVAACSGE